MRRLARWMAGGKRLPSYDKLPSRPYGQEKSVSAADRRMNPLIASIARRDATSPASCPPMPSATANRRTSASETKESSLVFLIGPASDVALARSTNKPPDEERRLRKFS